MKSSYKSHVIRIALGLIVFAVLGLAGKTVLTPTSFGTYGHYRGDAIGEEADRQIRIYTNASCLGCHAYEAQIQMNGKHRTISCEFCHGPYTDHIKDGKKIAALPVKQGEDIKVLCLRCHNKAIHARPKDIIKTVTMPDHLKKQKVKLTHLCVQCHHQHAPLKYIIRAEQILGMQEKT